MKIVNAMVGTLLLAAAPLAAQAEDMSYSYVDLGWLNTDIDNGPSADGFGLRGSIGFAEDFFAFAEYANQDVSGISIDQYAVGLGGRLNISDGVDLVGRVGYLKADASSGGFSVDADGYLVSAGIRGRVADAFELEGNVIHRDLGSGSDDTAIAVGGRYFFSENFAALAEYEISDDANTILAGVRFTF